MTARAARAGRAREAERAGPVDPASGSVELDGISVAWPLPDRAERTVVLDRFGLNVVAGSFTCVVGPSGCGKSTVLRILAGLLEPDRGTARVGGRDVVGRPGACAWAPQQDDLLPWRRVLGNTTLGAELGGRRPAEAETEARPLLERFGLGGLERAWPSELSGGMRQRVAVLRTFLVDSPVLLLDEPFGALDVLTRGRMQAWLQEVWLGAPGTRRTVLLVTHDVEEALLLGDRVVVLSERPGRIVADLPVDHPRPRPRSLVADPTFVRQRATLLAALGA